MGLALRTDLYQLTMTAGYWSAGLSERRAVFELFVRQLPPHRRYLLVAGLAQAVSYLNELRFEGFELEHLAKVLHDQLPPARLEGYLAYLSKLRFTGDLWAMPEGTVAFPGEPLLRIEAPLAQAQLVETTLLSCYNHATSVASKAARVVLAARGRPILEFGSRRTHPEAAVDAARAAYLAGCESTSNLEAIRRFGIPGFGTMSHSFILAFESERAAFESYAQTFPSQCTLLIDSYDSVRGARLAIEAAGDRLAGVRIDSGEMLETASTVRRLLNEAGLPKARIMVSDEMNEYRIRSILESGAPIDAFGVGTQIVTSADAPALAGVYKLVALEDGSGTMRPVAKFSPEKATFPGAKQVFRQRDNHGRMAQDDLGLAREAAPPGGLSLLHHVLSEGVLTKPLPTLVASREAARAELASLPPWLSAIAPTPDQEDRTSPPYDVRPTEQLLKLLAEVRVRSGV
jgi:nicotinate phosphoribosyltransferase